MGCIVNGPGEARKADFGIAGGAGEGVVFAHGQPVRKVPQEQLVDALFAEIARQAAMPAGRASESAARPSQRCCGGFALARLLDCPRARASRRAPLIARFRSRRTRCGPQSCSCPRSKKTRPTPRPSATS